MFTHQPLVLDAISSEDTSNGRYYDTPGGRFPSVTTVIGWYKGTEWLEDWKSRVGEDEARRVGTRARIRGTAVHDVAERYLKNEDWKTGVMPANLFSFLSIKPLLDKNIGRVMAVEGALWSSGLRTAGRVDLVAEWEGTPSIIDFKTSTRLKNDDDVWGYFIQKTCYGEMVEERTGLAMPQIVTLMMVDHEDPQVWVKRRADYREEMIEVFNSPRPGEVSAA